MAYVNRRLSINPSSLTLLVGEWTHKRTDIKSLANWEDHARAAITWINIACHAINDGGISKGYSLLRGKWAPSYPETTGYTIPTLLNCTVVLGLHEMKSLALSLAKYLLTQTTPEGAVVHWGEGAKTNPIVFDTGQVIFGWLAIYDDGGGDEFLSAARKAADWLISIQDPSGSWKKGQHLNVTKVIDTRVAWALAELRQRTQDSRYSEAAKKNLDWTIAQQNPGGWFNHCSFTPEKYPFTHTLAYTAEGLLECGTLLNKDEYISAARRMADALLSRQHADGSLASTYRPDWSRANSSSCLTGNCQIAHLWMRLFEITNDQKYIEAAKKSIAFVASTQNLTTHDARIWGAIAGSYPLHGTYEPFKYPNWAAKFFIDALLKLNYIDNHGVQPIYVG